MIEMTTKSEEEIEDEIEQEGGYISDILKERLEGVRNKMMEWSGKNMSYGEVIDALIKTYYEHDAETYD